jgi:hypothetical protein
MILLAAALPGRLHPRRLANDRHALAMLADSEDGCTEGFMRANGIAPKRITELIDAGLATAKSETVHAGGKAIEVIRVRITDDGRAALTRRRPR